MVTKLRIMCYPVEDTKISATVSAWDDIIWLMRTVGFEVNALSCDLSWHYLPDEAATVLGENILHPLLQQYGWAHTITVPGQGLQFRKASTRKRCLAGLGSALHVIESIDRDIDAVTR